MNIIKKLLGMIGFKNNVSDEILFHSQEKVSPYHIPQVVRVMNSKKVRVKTVSGRELSWKILRWNGEQLTVRRTGHPRCPALTVDFTPSIGDELCLEGFLQRN